MDKWERTNRRDQVTGVILPANPKRHVYPRIVGPVAVVNPPNLLESKTDLKYKPVPDQLSTYDFVILGSMIRSEITGIERYVEITGQMSSYDEAKLIRLHNLLEVFSGVGPMVKAPF